MWLQIYLNAVASHPVYFFLSVISIYMVLNLLLDDIGDMVRLMRKKD